MVNKNYEAYMQGLVWLGLFSIFGLFSFFFFVLLLNPKLKDRERIETSKNVVISNFLNYTLATNIVFSFSTP